VKGQATMDGVEKEEMAGMLATLMMTRAQLDAAEEIPKQINIQGREGVGKSGGKPPTQCGSTGSCCRCSGNSCCCCCCVVLSVQIRRVHNSAPLGQLLWQLQLQSAVWRQQHRATAYWGLSQLHSNVNQMPQQVANVQPIT